MTNLPPLDYRDFAPVDWPDVLVLVDEQWLSGELRAWIRTDDAWDGYVQYRTAPGQNYLARFPATQIREATRLPTKPRMRLSRPNLGAVSPTGDRRQADDPKALHPKANRPGSSKRPGRFRRQARSLAP